MPKEFSRHRRVADLLHRELAKLIQRDTREGSMGLVTVSTIDISPDLKNAKIFFTCIGSVLTAVEVTAWLNEQAGKFRHELSHLLVLRSVPKLQFEYDHMLERANKLTALIDSLQTGKKPVD